MPHGDTLGGLIKNFKVLLPGGFNESTVMLFIQVSSIACAFLALSCASVYI